MLTNTISKFPNLHHSPFTILSEWPMCHLPHMAVWYPLADSTSAMVTSSGDRPSSCPGHSTVVRPVRTGWRPVMMATREGVQLGSPGKTGPKAWTIGSYWIHSGPLSLVPVNLGNPFQFIIIHHSPYLDSPFSCQQKSAVELEKHKDTQTHKHTKCHYLKPTLQPGEKKIFRNIETPWMLKHVEALNRSHCRMTKIACLDRPCHLSQGLVCPGACHRLANPARRNRCRRTKCKWCWASFWTYLIWLDVTRFDSIWRKLMLPDVGHYWSILHH